MEGELDVRISEVDVLEWLGKILPADVAEDEEGYQGRFEREGLDFESARLDLRRVLDSLASKSVRDETILFDDYSHEILVVDTGPRRGQFFYRRPLVVEDSHNELVYTLGLPSDEYLMMLLQKALQEGSETAFLNPRGAIRRRIIEFTQEDNDEEPSVLELLRRVTYRSLSLAVSSSRKRTESEFDALANAALFQLGYNLNLAIVPIKSLEELSNRRIAGMRRAWNGELEPPRRTYREDLVHHYLLAIAAESPPLGFLSYYHVAEHFFEAVFRDDLIESVRAIITQPGFSYRRKRDIGRLINRVTSSMREQGDRVTFSEREALRLTLLKYIPNPEDLVEQIEEYDETLIDYYLNNEVGFSSGDKVDLRESSPEKLFDALAGRIYKTRNAIVHSKEGAKSSFIPYKHDGELAREMPMMRFIAESIITHSSTVL